MTEFNWKCPYCDQATTITNPNYSEIDSYIETSKSLYGDVGVKIKAISCPNSECKQLSLTIELATFEHVMPLGMCYNNKMLEWPLMPRSRAKPMPGYVPKAIRDDYVEACLILFDSPKASAALSRRCLQGIVRDFWDIPVAKRGNLGAELNYIKDKVDDDTWSAVHAIRSVGDIGAHMEKDVNVIIDVEPEEAELLIELIETLVDDWYVVRAKREERARRTKSLVGKKLSEKRAAKKARNDAGSNADMKIADSQESDGSEDSD